MSPTVTTKRFNQKDVVWQQYHLGLAVAEHQILDGKPFLILRPESGKIWWLKKVQHIQKKYHCQCGKKPKCIFHNLGNLLRHLELVQASRERVVPTEWQVRTVLRDCISKARVIPVQAPQYRQYALISDFLDLAHLSMQEEAALATNWIKDRPEGLKLQNLALATVTGPVLSSLLRNLTADIQYATNKCASLAHGNNGSFTGIHRYAQGIFPRIWQSFDVICLPNVHLQCCMLLQGTLGGDFDISAASGESIA